MRHSGPLTTPAMSAIEMACWDIVGKALNQPIYNLLGGMFHEKLRAYSYLLQWRRGDSQKRQENSRSPTSKKALPLSSLTPLMPVQPID